jgi:hypothetical protein
VLILKRFDKNLFCFSSIIEWRPGDSENYSMASVTGSTPVQMPSFQISAIHVNAKLRQKCIEGSRVLPETLETYQRIKLRDIVIGDENWIYLDTNPNLISIDAEKVPTRSRTTISSTKAMLAVFWDIRCVIRVNWLP